MKTAVLLLAAGSGRRFGGEMPKQYVEVNGKAIVLHTLEHLALEPRISMVQPVIAKGDHHFSRLMTDKYFPFDVLPAVIGGTERSISMQRGLAALPKHVELVAVHDAARPLPSRALLSDVLDVAERFGAAIPGLPVHDTIKRVNAEGKVLETPQRQYLRAVQTPQVAKRQWFEQAIIQESNRLHMHTDDASLLEAAGFDVYVSQGDVLNRKITTVEDLAWMASVLDEHN
ncbi:MAG: 2-C-methyl-D-erythritol 4-phosphate cytidylyltransferase [Mariprofundus sp.]|nr:2-C-methyl-D-erythritol 4-phosphate cytidylyltransferase [Mariprofundus sp.]